MDDSTRLSEQVVILADDLERAAEFYAHAFECEVETCADDRFQFVLPAVGDWGGARAVIRLRTPHDKWVTNLFRVASLETTIDRIQRAHGGVLIAYLIAGNALLSFCQDTEGNRFTIESIRSI